MATKYENYITGDDANFAFYLSSPAYNWNCMTFKSSLNFMASSAKFKLLRYAGSVPGILTAWLLATSGGVPTGSALATGTLSADVANAITTSSPGEWKEITFATPRLLLADTTYGLALKSSTDDTGAPIYWRYDTNDGAYTNGRKYITSDGGSTWTGTDPDDDFMFEIWGDPQGSGGGGGIFPSDDVARVSSIRHIFRPGFFRMQVGLGDLGLDIDVAETAVRNELDTAQEIEKAPPEGVLDRLAEFGFDQPQDRIYITPPGAGGLVIGEPTIPSVLEPTGRPLTPSSTPVAIRAEIIKLNRSLAASGLTEYARDVLRRRVAELKIMLAASLGRGR